jgi:hypothetical protein
MWLGMAIGATMGMGMEHEVADAHCEKGGKHCTFLTDLGSCRLYDMGLERDEEEHRRLNICKERNFVIGRTA